MSPAKNVAICVAHSNPICFSRVIGMDEETANAVAQMVLVSNIAGDATNKTVEDFFSFCGKILDITMDKDPASAELQTATIRFETDTAARTALLLTKAYIQDRQISVSPYSSVIKAPEKAQKEEDRRDGPSVVRKTSANVLAQSVILSTDATEKALELSDKLGITESYHETATVITSAASAAKQKLEEVDEAIGASHVTRQIADATTGSLKAVDEALGISESYESVKQVTLESEIVKKSSRWLWSSWEGVKSAWKGVEDEALQDIERERPDIAKKIRERDEAKKAAAAIATASTETATEAVAAPPAARVMESEETARIPTPIKSDGAPTPDLREAEEQQTVTVSPPAEEKNE